MKSFGDRLKQARQEQNIELETVAATTRIVVRYLEALERSDLDSLPGGAFDKGYIRSYAQFLGIDPQPILEAYAFEVQRRGRGGLERERQMLHELSRLVDQSSEGRSGGGLSPRLRGKRLAVAVLACGLLAGLGWVWFRIASGDTLPPGRELARSTPSTVANATTEPGGPETPLEKEQSIPDGSDSAAATEESHLVVADSGVGTGVVDRALVGASDRFQEGTQLWFWTRVTGGESGEVLHHIWLFEGRMVMDAELAIGGPHWRTYSTYQVSPGLAGSWAAEARREDGRVLARKEFRIVSVSNGDGDPSIDVRRLVCTETGPSSVCFSVVVQNDDW